MAPPPLAAVLSLTISLLLQIDRTAVAAPPPASDCVPELVTFSPCLTFVSAPPNNLSDAVRPECCAAFSAALASDRGQCFCHLLQEPRMLGFPLDGTRLLSLPSACDLPGQSLEALCSDSEAMAPSQNGTGSEISNPPDSAPSSQPSPPDSGDSATPPNSPQTSEEPGPPPEITPEPPSTSPTPSRSPIGGLSSSSASANRYCIGKCRFRVGTRITAFLLFFLSYTLAIDR